MAVENVNILMRLVSVDEIRFMMSSGEMVDMPGPDDLQIGFMNQVQLDEVDKDRISIAFGVRYELKKEPVLESVYRFVFEVKNLAGFVSFHENGSFTIKHLMPHLLSVAVGTMRGILVVKTAGTGLSNYPLPIIDSNELNTFLSSSNKADQRRG